MLNSTTHDVGGVMVITLEDAGDVPDDRQPSQRETLYKLVQASEDPRFAVDLGRLEYMSSADFGFLISLKRRVDAKKGKLVLFDVDPFIIDALKTMKLLSLFPIAEDLSGALLLLPSGVA
jgi:anti-anti-sigma factor